MATTTLNIEGMHCASCVARIEKSLKKNPAVKDASVNLVMEQGRVEYDESHASVDDLVACVREAGYEAAVKNQESPKDPALAGPTGQARIRNQGEEGQHRHSHDGHGMGLGHQHTPSPNLSLTRERDYGGHSVHAAAESGRAVRERLVKVIGAGVLSVILIALPFVGEFQNMGFLMLLLALGVVYFGREFFMTGLPNLVKGRPDMDTLVALGVGAAFAYSSYTVLFAPMQGEYFMDVGIVTTFILLGRFLEAKAKGRASEAIKKLLHLSAKVAHRIKNHESRIMNQEYEDVPVAQIQVGDVLLVKPGEKVPTDGVIIKGAATIDESMVTGESIPVDKYEGEQVIGATINGNQSFTMHAEKVGSETVLAHIVKLVQDAQMSKAPIQKLVDQISNYFVWVIIVIAIGTFGGWMFMRGEVGIALVNMVAVLVIACPCALGLATPISIVVGSGRGASLGILIKNAEVLEKMHKITAIAFDKTGTITEGKPVVTDIVSVGEVSRSLPLTRGRVGERVYLQDKQTPSPNLSLTRERDNFVLQIAASVESHSEHPLAQAIVKRAKEEGVALLPVEKFEAVTGRGVQGELKIMNQKSRILIGTRKLMEEHNVVISQAVESQIRSLEGKGQTVLIVALNNEVAGLIAVADILKENSAQAVAHLQKRGIRTIMLTGDNKTVAEEIGKKVGIQEVRAQVMPSDKVSIVKELQEKGEFVAMVGDGINDSPALAQANVGIAMGTGTDVAIESGDIVIVKGDLEKASESIALSRATLTNIKQNLAWAFAYNIILVPVAALGYLNPAFSAAAMALSSVSVVFNALRLKRVRLY